MAAARRKPNIILIMTDDQGYGDLSCMGATDFVTPHIDALAQRGARFTSFYSNSPVCSPSRASLLTGRYPGKAGVRAILGGFRRTSGLTPDAPTLAAALKREGYATGVIGKWHLGLSERSRPLNNGFDYFYGFMAGCVDYYSHVFYWGDPQRMVHDLWENNDEIHEDGRYFTDLITDRAVEYVRGQCRADAPFMLYLAYNAPHYPMHAPKKYMDRFAHLPWDRRVMAAMISAVDDGVGRVVDELKRQGRLDDTCVYFQSDNGPSRETRNWMDGRTDPYYGGTAGGLKGHKFSLFEGGIRVPAIVSWPDRIPGGQVIGEPCAAMDVFPTLLAAVGGDASRHELDGMDIMPMLTEGACSPHDMLFWEMDGQTAVRAGRHKLVLNGCLVEGEPAPEAVALYDIIEDMSERHNLADAEPCLARRLTDAALEWRAALEKQWEERWAGNYANLT